MFSIWIKKITYQEIQGFFAKGLKETNYCL